jgi:hypothetical protein
MSKRETKGGPLWSLGLWTADLSVAELVDHTVVALHATGVTTVRSGTTSDGHALIELTSKQLPSSPPGGVTVAELPVHIGALVEVCVSGAKVDGAPVAMARRLAGALAGVVLAVRPALATLSVEHPPAPLPYPDSDEAWGLFVAGWVDPAQCNDSQVAAFERLRDRGRAWPWGEGLWWSGAELLCPDALTAAHDWDRGISEQAYECWMRGVREPWAEKVVDSHVDAGGGSPASSGRAGLEEGSYAAPGLPAVMSAPPQLWFWSAEAAPEALAERVRHWLEDDGFVVWTGPEQDPRWRPVVATAPSDMALAEALEALRTVAGEVACDWAGLHPEGWLAVPGLDPTNPATGIVAHVWVRDEWLGPDAAALRAAMPGAHHEVVADGVLWVTSPALAPDVDPSWSDHDVRFDRWVAAATVLAAAARRTVSGA